MFQECSVVVLCFAIVQAKMYNQSDIDLSKCKTHYSRSGSVYKDFYSISETPSANDTLLLDFHFSVLAPSDAHILLASSDKVQKTDPAYEIVIGAGGNTFCDIRRKQKSDVKSSVRVKGLLNALDPQSFWLHITKDGDIAVGKEGEELPFISWVDPDPLPLKVISFSTWSGVEAKWYFDCEFKHETEEIQRPLTDLDRLRKDYLYHYNPYVRPVKHFNTTTTVSLAININHVALDEKRSVIEVLGVTKMGWQDEKLRWNPHNYSGIQVMHIFRREIWQPDLCLYNAVGDIRDLLEDTLMVVHYTGYVEWNPAIKMKAFCEGQNLETWPKETHKCNLIMGFMREFNHMRISFNRNDSSLIYYESSEWSILEADVITNISAAEQNITSEPAIFEINLTIKRNSMALDWIFFSPFILISISVLSSFWIAPFGQLKISVVSAQLVICTLILLSLSLIVPNHSKKVPYIVSLYSYTLLAILIAIIVSIVVVNLARSYHKKAVPHVLCTILTSKCIRIFLCLPNVKMADNYGNLYDTQEKHQTIWVLMGTAIDRLTFIIYLMLSIYTIILKNNYK
ncbi:neuronal acetylcholine receptor subunit non-alpha-2-like [Diabrotica undecimpunctata]|uniref:neuronal acetylcholine receptor subunit non-alpha-2-like n=1 Tax=Diabrotica undecimpunctata TaxID=50387 RepID=UPI003B6364B8